MPRTRDKSSVLLTRITLVVAVCAGAFVPVMQVVMDHSYPSFSKPVLVGIFLSICLVSLCLLPTRWHMRLLFMSMAGLLTLGTLELVCSILFGRDQVSIYEWDDRTLYRLRPNSRKAFTRTAINGGDRISVSINSQGFRGPELSAKPGTRRMIVYGDSFVEAEYSEFGKTFVDKLGRELTDRTRTPIETVNAGVIGFGPDQMLLRMEDEIPRLKPECVVACFFADNDLGDLLRNKLFRLDASGQLISHAWQLAPECRHPGLRGPYEPTLWKWTRNVIRGLQTQGPGLESYMSRWLSLCEEEYRDYVTHGDAFVYDLQVDHYDADVSLTPDSESARYKAALFRGILERMKSVCDQNSTQLFVVIIPSPADLMDDYDFCSIDRAAFPDYEPRAITNVMVHAAESLEIPHVNLFDQFKAETDVKALFFRGGDNHWNDRGQLTAAKAVARNMTDNSKMQIRQ